MRYVLTLVFASGHVATHFSDSRETDYLFTWYPFLQSVTVEHAQ